MFHSIDIIQSGTAPNGDYLIGQLSIYLSVKYAPKWRSGVYYNEHFLVKYDGKVYFCNSPHTSGRTFNYSKFTLIYLDYNTKGFWNTWEDWHLIPSSRPVFASPKKKKRTVEIPGSDSVLDLSDNFQNGPIYENSEGSWEFYVDNDWESWETIYDKLLNTLHGKNFLCILEDDPGFYHIGSIAVNQWKSEAKNSKIVLDYSVFPYKYSITTTSDDVYWDPIVFETDYLNQGVVEIVSDYVKYTRIYDSSGFTKDHLDFYTGRKRDNIFINVYPDSSLTLTIYKVATDIYGAETETQVHTKSFSNGVETDQVLLEEGHYVFRFTGTGSIEIIYREGRL